MAILQTTNVQGALCVNGVAVGGSKDHKYCCFTASTTFTPSQDLVDGNGFISADVVGAGGGSGAWGITSARTQCYYCFYSNSTTGRAGFIQNPQLTISSTDACTVGIGAGGSTGSVTWTAEAIAYTCCRANQGTGSWTAGGAGGSSCFGTVDIAYGGEGGRTVVYSCNQANGSESFCLDGAASPDPHYINCAQGGALLNICASGGSKLTKTDGSYSGSAPVCLQYGVDCNYGKIGFSGVSCALGQNSAQFGVQNQRDWKCSMPVDTPQVDEGYNKSVVALPGNPGNGYCVCYRGQERFACPAFIASGSYSFGQDGIVVIHWDE